MGKKESIDQRELEEMARIVSDLTINEALIESARGTGDGKDYKVNNDPKMVEFINLIVELNPDALTTVYGRITSQMALDAVSTAMQRAVTEVNNG